MNWGEAVGSNIRLLRREAGLTQEALADHAGIAMRYLAGIERGEENPSLSFLVKIAEALGVLPADLFATDDKSIDARGD